MRRVREIRYSGKFLKRLARLPKKIIEKARERELIFREDALDSRLRTHHLHGAENTALAFWIDFRTHLKNHFYSDFKTSAATGQKKLTRYDVYCSLFLTASRSKFCNLMTKAFLRWVLPYRITFIFLNEEEVLFLDVGTHNDVYK